MSAAMAAGALAQAAGSIGVFVGSMLQKTPDVPEWRDVSIAEETELATKEAQAALPGIKSLFKDINTFMGSELMRGMETLVPGSTAAVARNIGDMLAGKLPTDVVKNLASSANARMLGLTGTSKSQFRDFFGVEKLGEVGMKYQQQGFQNLLAYGQALMPQLANPVAWLTNPFQRAQMTFQNREMEWQRNMLANQMSTLESNKFSNALISAGSTMSGAGAGMMANAPAWGSFGGGSASAAPTGMTMKDYNAWGSGAAGGPDWSQYSG